MRGEEAGETRGDALFAVAVFALALAARLVYLFQSLDNPSFFAPVVDAGDYDLAARRLLETSSLDVRFFWQPFFYPLFLAGVYKLSAGSILAAKLVQALLGSLTCVLVLFLGRRLCDRATGFVAAAATALYGPLIYFESELLATGWAAFWAVALLLLTLRAAPGRGADEAPVREARIGIGMGVGMGMAGALAVLTRPSFLPFVLAAWAWLFGRSLRSAGSAGGAARRPAPWAPLVIAPLAGALLLVVPVAAIRHDATGRAGFLPASGGLNAYIGNNPDVCRTLAIRPGRAWQELVETPARHGATGLEESNRFFVSQVRRFAADEPLAFARGLALKALRFASSRELPRNTDVYFASRWSSWLALLVWKIGSFGFPFGLLLPFAALGLWLRRFAAPLWLFLGLYPATVVLIFVSARYRAPIVPVLAVPAAAGALALVELVRRRKWKRVAASAGLLAAVSLVTILPGPFCEERLDLEADFYACLAHSRTERGDVDGAVSSYRESLGAAPDQADVHYNLALLLSGRGDLEQAAHHYAEALRIEPDHAAAANNLGSVVERQGRLDAALELFAEAARLDPELAAAHRNLGRALLATGRGGEARGSFERAMALEPRPAEDHLLLGGAALQTGDLETAIRELEKAVRLAPTARALNDLGVAHLGRGEHQTALARFEAAIRLHPDSPDPWANAGVASTLLGRLDEARAFLETAVRKGPRHVDSRYNLAVVLSRLGDRRRAIDELETVLELAPDQERARALLTRLSQTP